MTESEMTEVLELGNELYFLKKKSIPDEKDISRIAELSAIHLVDCYVKQKEEVYKSILLMGRLGGAGIMSIDSFITSGLLEDFAMTERRYEADNYYSAYSLEELRELSEKALIDKNYIRYALVSKEIARKT